MLCEKKCPFRSHGATETSNKNHFTNKPIKSKQIEWKSTLEIDSERPMEWNTRRRHTVKINRHATTVLSNAIIIRVRPSICPAALLVLHTRRQYHWIGRQDNICSISAEVTVTAYSDCSSMDVHQQQELQQQSHGCRTTDRHQMGLRHLAISAGCRRQQQAFIWICLVLYLTVSWDV